MIEHESVDDQLALLEVSYGESSMTIDNAPDVLNVEEVAALLRIGRNGAYDLVKSGVLRSVKIGRRIVVAKSSLLLFLYGRDSPSSSGEDARR